MKIGDRVIVRGHSKDLWINFYNCEVDTIGTLEETPDSNQKKVLVTLDEIDHEGHVCCLVRKSKITST